MLCCMTYNENSGLSIKNTYKNFDAGTQINENKANIGDLSILQLWLHATLNVTNIIKVNKNATRLNIQFALHKIKVVYSRVVPIVLKIGFYRKNIYFR